MSLINKVFFVLVMLFLSPTILTQTFSPKSLEVQADDFETEYELLTLAGVNKNCPGCKCVNATYTPVAGESLVPPAQDPPSADNQAPVVGSDGHPFTNIQEYLFQCTYLIPGDPRDYNCATSVPVCEAGPSLPSGVRCFGRFSSGTSHQLYANSNPVCYNQNYAGRLYTFADLCARFLSACNHAAANGVVGSRPTTQHCASVNSTCVAELKKIFGKDANLTAPRCPVVCNNCKGTPIPSKPECQQPSDCHNNPPPRNQGCDGNCLCSGEPPTPTPTPVPTSGNQ